MEFIFPNWIIHLIALTALSIASITDLKKREVPDLINYSLIVLGLIIGLMTSIIQISFWPLTSSILGLILGYIIGALMFYTGQWGGGDAKMLMGLGALLGFDIYSIIENGLIEIGNSIFINIFISIFIAGIIYGIGFLIVLAIKNKKEFLKILRKKLRNERTHKIRLTITTISFAGILSSLLIQEMNYKIFLMMVSVSIYLIFYLILSIQIIEKNILVVAMPITELTPGEWPSKNLFFTINEQSPVKSIKQKVALFYEKGTNHNTKKKTTYVNKKTKEVITNIVRKIYSKKYVLNKYLWIFNYKKNKKEYSELHKKIIFALHLESESKFNSYIKKNNLEELKTILDKENIFFKKRYIAGPKDLGLNNEQISIIKRKKLKTLLVKKGIPFIPAFLLGYILVLLLTHWNTTIIGIINLMI